MHRELIVSIRVILINPYYYTSAKSYFLQEFDIGIILWFAKDTITNNINSSYAILLESSLFFLSMYLLIFILWYFLSYIIIELIVRIERLE